MIDRKEIKKKAKEFAFNNKWNVFKPLLCYALLWFIFEIISGFICNIIGTDNGLFYSELFFMIFEILTIPMLYGYNYYLIKLVRGEKLTVKEALLSKYNIFVLLLVTSVLVSIFTSLWSLLLIVPGIIYAFKMAMVRFILSDDGASEMKSKEIMEKSKKMMDGHKNEYFVFGLSFIGWILLVYVTFGIAAIWTIPYMFIANVMYYEKLKEITK